MTERKKLGLAMIVGHAVGVIVGIVVYATTSTPAIVPLAVGFICDVATQFIGYAIVRPDVPA